ncbi:MAG: tRNA-dihydrouridine synthase [Candidatus Thermoplasmatota archaeon]|nr:tRNA-dihydrouridine synthase [Candidatus Thermoplasmatota archaeon]
MKPSVFQKILREKKLLLPPLSGYTDYPYRMILAQFHPPFLCTEMVNARALLQNNWRSKQIVQLVDGDQYNGVQLVGSIPEAMAKAAQIVAHMGCEYIDVNMGCTARKVTSRGEGVSLMKQEDRACEIVAAITAAVDLPVTCKLRLGASKHALNVVSLSQKLVDAGSAAITIHGRSGEKKFGMPVDLSIIRHTAAAVQVPVVANGGISNGADAVHILQDTDAAAVMPGRGLIGNPWIVPEVLSRLSDQRYSPPDLQQKKDVCLQHLDLLVSFYGERRAVLKMRSILPHYFSSCMFLKELKKDLQQVTTASHIPLLLERIQGTQTHDVYRGVHHR